ncbi:hypothetical protein [Nostoc favosum]|uniref:Uncharacterized protein n=1 Tax=Nostoc favosum CHAB5714 TaxID=2780399 RepID=A0ABS8IG58_9NOSO|nr:hypothetical protein [Nostoc favosum]MCC5602821.1 hypothetical protein [Nostoc favosum CHAB5714]
MTNEQTIKNHSKPEEVESLTTGHITLKKFDIDGFLPKIKDTNFQIKQIPIKQEETRTKLALYLVYTLIGTLFLSFVLTGVAAFSPDKEDRNYFKDLITLVITSQTGLIGTVLGFYFGAKNNET